MVGGLLQMVIPAGWDFAAADTDASPATAAGGVTATANLLSGATDKTVRVPIGTGQTVGITLNRHNCAYPSETDSNR